MDDDPSIRRLLVTFLRRRGYEMLEAINGREALATMHAGNTELVLMDLVMPEMSGWDVLRERAADPLLLRIPMIVISANDTRQVTADVVGKGVYAVIGKPFDLDALLATIRKCLEQTDVVALVAA